MGNPQPRAGESFTYGDYLTWPDEERWELIDGVPYDMTPAPAPKHQVILGELGRQFGNYLLGRPCRVFPAPFDVRLAEEGQGDDQTDTVVQPDLSIICNPSKIDRRGCQGAPDFVLEIISPSTAARDHITKAELYGRYGVREYWILHPTDRILIIRSRDVEGGFSAPKFLAATGTVPVGILSGLEIDLDLVFQVAEFPAE